MRVTAEIYERIMRAKARRFPRIATDLYLGPQEAHELAIATSEFDVSESRIYGMTIHVVAEPGVALA